MIASTGEKPNDLCASSLRESAVRGATMSFDIATAGLYREVPATPLRVWAVSWALAASMARTRARPALGRTQAGPVGQAGGFDISDRALLHKPSWRPGDRGFHQSPEKNGLGAYRGIDGV